jgi:hypothetical protein
MIPRSKKIIRVNFPRVYKIDRSKSVTYFLVDVRRKKWGLNERKTFSSKSLAIQYAIDIEKNLPKLIVPKDVPKEKVVLADRFEDLSSKLAEFQKSPEDAVKHYIEHMGQETLRQVKPFVSKLVDEWMTNKRADTTVSKRYLYELSRHAKFIKKKWGELKPDEVKKNAVDLMLKGMKVSNNTRRKFRIVIGMFFKWVMEEGHITKNPTTGLKFKSDEFNGAFYSVEETKKLLRYVVDHHKDLIGYFAVLTFAGLRPTEGLRVQWGDYLDTHSAILALPAIEGLGTDVVLPA